MKALPLLIVICMLVSCTANKIQTSPQEVSSIDWKLSPRAQMYFLYLKYWQEQKKNPQAALLTLEELLQIAPSPALFMEKARTLWQAKNMEGTRSALKQGLKIFPGDRELSLALAQSYLIEQRPDAALTTLQDYLRYAPQDFSVVEKAAEILLDQKGYAQVMDMLEAIPEEKRSPQTFLLLGKAASRIGLNAKAEKNLKKAARLAPDSFQAKSELAFFYELQKEYIEAEKIYAELFEKGKDNSQVLMRLIKLNLKLNNPDRALQFIQSQADNQEILTQAAALFIAQQFYEQADQLLSSQAQSEPIPQDVLYFLAILAFEYHQNPEQALFYLQSIPEDNKYFAKAVLLQIQILIDTDQADQALELAQKATRLFPEVSAFSLIKANILIELDRQDKALQVLKQAVKKWPQNMKIKFRLGSTLYQQGLKDEGIKIVEQIIQKDPDNAAALNFLGYTLTELDSGSNLDRALVLIQRAIKSEPNNGYYLDSLAWVYFKMGQNKQAWTIIQQALEAVDSDPIMWEHYGDIALSQGLKSKARQAFKKAISLEGDNKEQVQSKLDKI